VLRAFFKTSASVAVISIVIYFESILHVPLRYHEGLGGKVVRPLPMCTTGVELVALSPR